VSQSNAELERRVGSIVKDRYQLTELIGVGGQGAVYRARDVTGGGGEVAVKVLHDAVDKDPTARERLSREAQALRALDGTASVGVIDLAFTPEGRLCLVMELLMGEDLDQALTRIEGQGIQFRVVDIPFLFAPLASTLERAHAIGIVHRDMKPQNIFLQQVGGGVRVRLMDFGFARFENLRRLTMDGFVAGSPSYLAPETWAQKPVTQSVDTYALGAMMYRVLAGKPPFQSKNMVEMLKMVTGGPRPSLAAARPELPPAVDEWARKALAAEPSERFPGPVATYKAFCEALGIAP